MKKIIIFALLIATIFLTGCYSKSYIKEEIAKANYCDTKEDCVKAGNKCPFGCNIYVNKNDADRIKELVSSYRSNCMYDCAYCPDVECEDNKCKAVCR